MWTVLLKGNLDLSITMTFASTVAAVAMLPLWLFTLGRMIYDGTTTKVPVHNILGSLGSMIFFLGIGLLFQRYLPRVAKVGKSSRLSFKVFYSPVDYFFGPEAE